MALIFKRGVPTTFPAPATPTYDVWFGQAHVYFSKYLSKTDAAEIWANGQCLADLPERIRYYGSVIQQVEQEMADRQPTAFSDYVIYKWKPVDIETFICDPYYLNKKDEIFPGVLEAAIELNNGKYVEAVLTGGIGSGKTTLALYTNAYQLYLLSCMRSPHKVFGLDPSSEIILIFQSITKNLAQGVDYQRFRSMLEGSQYFLEKFPFRKDLEAKLVFPNRIEVAPVSGSETAAIGQNVMGGLIDELNYMAMVEKSKASVDKGTTYDQAVMLYNSISRRRKSRFMENGKLPGVLCLVSSKKYPGQFTDLKMEEAKSDPTIFVYDKRVWDIKPKDYGKHGWFSVFAGDLTRKPRIMQAGELVPDADRHLVVAIPEEYRTEFNTDVINALREIAGVSTLARHPYFLEVDKVNAAFEAVRVSIFGQSVVDFVQTRLTLRKSAFYKPQLPRFVHVDLAISGDSAGLVIGTVVGFKNVSTNVQVPAYMPLMLIDGTLEIRAPRNSEILFSKIRETIRKLQEMGLNIRWITFDQFQSTDSQQVLRQWGFTTGLQSMDTVPCHAYDFTKSAMYEGRVSLPKHDHLQTEILMLEKDTKTGKVDHPPGGSKDVADALAGVVYGLTMRREIWSLYRIPIVAMPASVLATIDKMKTKEAQPDYASPTEDLSPYQTDEDKQDARSQRLYGD